MRPTKRENETMQREFKFSNGYGASVIDTGYGCDQGLLELAVLHKGHLCYTTPITNDVKGWLTEQDVNNLLKQIAALPSKV
jgi:hypothetical protein